MTACEMTTRVHGAVTRRRVRRFGLLLMVSTLLIVPFGSDGSTRGAFVGSPGIHEAAGAVPGLRHVETLFTAHGNAAHLAWSDDGKHLFLANEEGRMSAVGIDVSDPAKPFISSVSDAENFLWATAQQNGVLVFQQSFGHDTLRLDPKSFAVLWKHSSGASHAIATDGSRIFVPVEGEPGTLATLGPAGQELSRVAGSDAWGSVYGAAYAADTRRLYVAVSADRPKGFHGGIYIYDVSGTAPALKGRIPLAASNIAVRGTHLWTDEPGKLDVWNVADPTHPVLRGAWEAPTETGPGRTPVQRHYGILALNKAGTRLYVTYSYRETTSGHVASNWPVGFLTFDVSGAEPRQLAQHDWKIDGECRLEPVAVSLSPDEKTLAVSYWRFGVRLFGVAGGAITELGMVGTTGEAHDVYVDSSGLVYVFANDNMQIIDPKTKRILKVVPFCNGGPVDGGWRPFKGGTLISRWSPIVWTLEGGNVDRYFLRSSAPSSGLHSTVWDNVFEDPYLYGAGDDGSLHVLRISGEGPFKGDVVGSVRVPRADGAAKGPAWLMAVAKRGNLVWTLGPTVGLATIDVGEPTSPRLVAQDRFTFAQNGGHVGLAVAHGRVYAGAGADGVLIYNPATLKRSGAIIGLNADFLDTIGDDFLVVANYWYPKLPEGVYVYDLRADPDHPALVDRYPQPGGNANFRARVFGHRVYRVALYGIDILDGP